MTDYTCTGCGAAFSLAGIDGPLHCPKCGAEIAERLPDSLEEVAAQPAAGAPAARPPAGRSAADRTGAGARRRAPAPTRGAASPRGAARRPAAAPPRRGKPLLAIVGVAIAIGIGVGWFAMHRDSATPDAGDAREGAGTAGTVTGSGGSATPGGGAASTPAAGSPGTASAPVAYASPAAEYRARLDALAPADLAGRRALAAFCREKELNKQWRDVQREILLLDSEDEKARRALRFTRHDAADSPFAGRWLTKADEDLAAAYDAAIKP